MNFDGESILFDDLGAATSSLPMCVRVVDLAHDTSIAGDISHSSIAGIADNYQFELGPNAAPALTHLLGTSKNARLYTLRELAPVTNLSPRKKKSRP